jgi:hypothetical protein
MMKYQNRPAPQMLPPNLQSQLDLLIGLQNAIRQIPNLPQGKFRDTFESQLRSTLEEPNELYVLRSSYRELQEEHTKQMTLFSLQSQKLQEIEERLSDVYDAPAKIEQDNDGKPRTLRYLFVLGLGVVVGMNIASQICS